MSPGHDEAPTPANAGATNRQNRNNPKVTRSDARLDLVQSESGCAECGGRLGAPKPGRSICPQCHLDYLAGLRRRHAAESRVQPLSDWGWAS